MPGELQGSYGQTDRQTLVAQLTLVLRLSLLVLQLSQDTLTFPRLQLLTLRVHTHRATGVTQDLHGAREVCPGAGGRPTQSWGTMQGRHCLGRCTGGPWLVFGWLGSLCSISCPSAVPGPVPRGRAVTAHQHCPGCELTHDEH